MSKTRSYEPVLVRMPSDLKEKLQRTAGLGGKMAPIVRRAVEMYLSREGNGEEYVSVGKLGKEDKARVRRYVDLLREADPDIRELADLQIQRLTRLNTRLK